MFMWSAGPLKGLDPSMPYLRSSLHDMHKFSCVQFCMFARLGAEAIQMVLRGLFGPLTARVPVIRDFRTGQSVHADTENPVAASQRTQNWSPCSAIEAYAAQ